jgi:hypothetical protein
MFPLPPSASMACGGTALLLHHLRTCLLCSGFPSPKTVTKRREYKRLNFDNEKRDKVFIVLDIEDCAFTNLIKY